MNFWLVKSNTTDVFNTVDPIKRDVAAAGANGMSLRFRTDKPGKPHCVSYPFRLFRSEHCPEGPWFFHCHIFWHMQAGLATVMLVDPNDASAEIAPDDAWESLCPAYDALPAELQ